MISAPVTDLGSMFPYSANTAGTPKASETGFSDNLMAAIRDSEQTVPNLQTVDVGVKTQTSTVKTQSSQATERTAPRDDTETNRSTEENLQTDSRKTETEEPIRNQQESPKDEIDSETKETVDETVAQAKKAVIDVLNVSEEEIEDALEVLGLVMADILNPQNLNQLVLQLTGSEDMTAVLTDENLYQNMTDLREQIGNLTAELAEELDLTPEELEGVLDQIKAQAGTEETAPVLEGMKDYSVKGEQNGEQVTFDVTVDDTTGTVTVQSTVTAKAPTDRDEKDEESGKQDSDKMPQEVNPEVTSSDQLGQNEQFKIEVPQMPEADNLAASPQEISEQILDYMKVQTREELTHMELQLHPASLGNVNIAITAKEGMVTAQFTAQNETVRAAIESQIVELKQQLEDQGIKVEAVEVTVANYENHGQFGSETGQESGSGQNAQKSRTRRISLDDLDEAEELEEADRITADMMAREGNNVDFTA